MSEHAGSGTLDSSFRELLQTANELSARTLAIGIRSKSVDRLTPNAMRASCLMLLDDQRELLEVQEQTAHLLVACAPGQPDDFTNGPVADTGHLTEDSGEADALYERLRKLVSLQKALRMRGRQTTTELVRALLDFQEPSDDLEPAEPDDSKE